MTKKEIIKEIGLDNYYGSSQEKANEKLLQCTEGTLNLALEVWHQNPCAQTREFIGRVLTGIFKFNCAVDEVRA